MLTSQKFKAKNLHMVSDFINMRFTLQNNKLYLQQKARRKKIVPPTAPTPHLQSTKSSSLHKNQKTMKTKSLFQIQKSTIKQTVNIASPIEETTFQLRFVQKLSQEHIIVGNQYQINLIHLGNVLEGFIEVQHKWSLSLKGIAQSFSVERKFNLIGLASLDTVWIYKYDLKNDHKIPELILCCPRTEKNEEIIQIRFIRNAGIFIIMKTKLEFYRLSWVCQKAQLLKSLEYKYQIDVNMSIFRIPDAWDTTLNVYYYQKKPQSDKFNLWMQSFVILAGLQIPQIKKKVRIYSLEQELKDRIQIFNYNSEICFIQFQNKLIAFKNGFVIDAVSTNIHQPSYFIRYVPSQRTLFHFLESFIDIYSLAMIQKSKPEKFQLLCRDCLQFSSKINGKLFQIIHLGHDKFAFFFETQSSKTTSNNPNITYHFAVTEAVDLKTKIDKIYPPLGQLDNYSLQQLYQKSSIAEKMGMNKRQAFLQLWCRSGKSSITDFQILLSTRDFPTIQQQIEYKLKRHSMSVRQLLKIYSQCLNMLQQRVFSDSCTLQDLKQFACCHFLIRKLETFRWISSQQHNPDGVISMNVKDYYEYKELSLIPQIVKLISQYLTKPKNEYLLKLRAIFKFFRIICKIQYQQILTTIVQKCKLRILQILRVVPELLPYETGSNNDFQIHLWGLITEQQLQQNLFLSQMLTIDNRSCVQDFPKHIWFKRYLYTTHGVIKDVDKKSTIKYLSKKNNIESIFYMFLCQVYHLNVFNSQLRDLITFVEMKYQFMPGHLRGKLELYFIMFSIFSEIDKKLLLSQFLRLRQHSLFKLYFQRQKSQKGGFILKKIKPLYEQLLNKGKQVFNQGIYEYFSSQQSSVSDLKCILSKLNNQKNEFHLSSQHLYEVLINAIMHKIKVGSAQDTPIDEILVYIQNIPFPVHNESIMTNLQYIQQINYQSQTLRKIKVNMTLYDIIKKGQRVIEMMVDHQIQRHQMERIRDYRNLRIHAYKILAEIQCRKSNIYGDSFHNYSLKIFLINLMSSHIDMIPLCKQLLSDKYLMEQFQMDDQFKQTIVMHVYQWKLSLKKQGPNPYCNHTHFITLLKDLLQPENPKRKFIEASMRYADIFTLSHFKIEYPLFPTFSYYPALADIQALFQQIISSDLISLDLDLIFKVMIELKQLGQAQMHANFFIEGYENKVKIELHEIYLVRLVRQRQLKLALDVVDQLLKIPNQYSFLNIVYPLLILERTYQEVLFNTAMLLNRVISFTFNDPAELCMLLRTIYSQKFSNIELDNLLKRYLKKKQLTPGFSIHNPIFKQKFSQSNDPINQNNLLQFCLERILKINEVFRKNHSMQLVFRLMCHNSLSMAKWIWCKGSGINMKTFRAFISYMTFQLLFDADNTLKQAINVLEILNFKYTNTIFFSQILKFRQYLTSNALNYNLKGNFDESQHKAIKLITQSIQILNHKRQQIQTKSIKAIRQNENADFQIYLNDPKLYQQREVSEYVYSDKDDAYQDLNDVLSIKSKWRSRHESNAEHTSDGIISRKYQEIPLPTSIRHRKNSEYFPQMLDIQQNFKNTKRMTPSNNPSLASLRNYSFNLNGIQQNKIQKIIQDQCQNMSSLVLINIDSSKLTEQDNLHLVSKMRKSESIILEDDLSKKPILIAKQSQQQEQYTIYVNKQTHLNPKQLINNILITTNEGNTSIFDLSMLRTQSKKEDFTNYFKKVLAELYSMKNIPFQRVIKLLIAIVQEFKKQVKLNKQSISIFKSLSMFKNISNLSFDFRSALPTSILFLTKIDDAYENFQSIIMSGINSLQVFPRLQFVQQVAGQQWKQNIIVLLVLQKIELIKELKTKLHHKSISKNEELRLLKDLEMEQLKISALVDESDNLIQKLHLQSTQLRQSGYQNKKELGDILKMSIDAIKIDSMYNN